jgi:ankyrin repeat protein
MADPELIVKAEAGDAAAVERLIATGASPDAKAQGGETALMRAAARGHIEVMQRLLSAGAKIDAATDAGNTALMFAAARGRVDALQMLLAKGARPDHRNKFGLGAAEWAKWSERQREVVALLGIEPAA